MLWIQDNQRVTVWEVKDKGKYSEVRFSSARKDKKEEDAKFINSTWSFVHFVGEAYKKSGSLKKGDRIQLKGAGISLEPYDDAEGNTKYPEKPKLVVFNFEKYVPEGNHESPKEAEEEDVPDFLKED